MKCPNCNYDGEFEKIVIRDSYGYECKVEVKTDFYMGKYKYDIKLCGCPKCGIVKFIKEK